MVNLLDFFNSFLAAWAFIAKFLLCRDHTDDPSVREIRKFAGKASKRNPNKKLPFGAAEDRKLWDCIDTKKGGVEKIQLKDFRTFMRFTY